MTSAGHLPGAAHRVPGRVRAALPLRYAGAGQPGLFPLDMDRMKTLLVTGGAGFIGGNFVLGALAQGGWRIVNLDALTYAGNRDTLAAVEGRSDYAFVHGDIGD